MTVTMTAPPGCNCGADATRDHTERCPLEQWLRASDRDAYFRELDTTPLPVRDTERAQLAAQFAAAGNWALANGILAGVNLRSAATTELRRTIREIDRVQRYDGLAARSGWAMAVFHGHQAEHLAEVAAGARHDNVARDWYTHDGYATSPFSPGVVEMLQRQWDAGIAHPQDVLAAYLATDLNTLPNGATK